MWQLWLRGRASILLTQGRWFAAAMQGADQHIRSSFGFSILPKDSFTCRLRELNQQPTSNETLTLAQSHSFRYRSLVQDIMSMLMSYLIILSSFNCELVNIYLTTLNLKKIIGTTNVLQLLSRLKKTFNSIVHFLHFGYINLI